MSEDNDLLEDQYGDFTRREERQRRKDAQYRDRSKYKKTDQDKVRPEPAGDETQLLGRVINLLPEGATVAIDDRTWFCILRGALKKNRTQDKNLLAVGDLVRFVATDESEGLVMSVEPRRSILARADTLHQRKQHIIASNVDQVLITTSVHSPQIKATLVDRYIISARKGGLKPVVIINKIDLLDDAERPIVEEMQRAYPAANIPILCVSAESGIGMEALKEQMRDQVSVFAGQSGVGKSSLINTVANYSLRVGDTVRRTRKGAHTTTQARLLHLPFGGWCVDTPGVQSFGVWDLQLDEVRHHFQEIQELATQCRFPSCTHLHEPECAVIDAVEAGKLSLLRYESYRQLTESILSGHKRR